MRASARGVKKRGVCDENEKGCRYVTGDVWFKLDFDGGSGR